MINQRTTTVNRQESSVQESSASDGSDWGERAHVEILAEEYVERLRNGSSVTIDEFIGRFPEDAETIRAVLPTAATLENLKEHHLKSGAPVDLQLDLNQRLGDYRLIREIGRGGMGVVYEAQQESLARPVAVKIFPQHVIGESAQLRRFRREARTAARLHHTNIVPVFGVGQEDDLHFFVMQKIDGESLDRVIGRMQGGSMTSGFDLTSPTLHSDCCVFDLRDQTGVSDARSVPNTLQDDSVTGLSDQLVAQIGIQVADALAYAHSQGVLHRDIKPGNLILDPSGTVWVTDFGLATPNTDEHGDLDVVGTIRFMAPEQFSGTSDERCDVYSLGVTLYELLTLQPAFEYCGRERTIATIRKGLPRNALGKSIHPDLTAIIRRACSVDPKNRYATAVEMAEDLRRFQQHRPVRARRLNAAQRLFRYCRRNPTLSSLVLLLIAVVTASLSIVSIGWHNASTANTRAEENLELALESLEDMLRRFDSDRLSQPVMVPTNDSDGVPVLSIRTDLELDEDLHESALRFYERFADSNPSSHKLAHDIATAHRRIGRIYHRKGEYAAAEQAFTRALLQLKRIRNQWAEYPAERLDFETASVRIQLGETLQAASQFADAASQFHHASTTLRKSDAFHTTEFQVATAVAESQRGQAVWMLQQHSHARQCYFESIRILEAVVESSPAASYRLELARSLHGLSRLRFWERREAVVKDRERAIAILEDLVAAHPEVPDFQCELVEMLTGAFVAGNADEAETMRYERAVVSARKLSAAHSRIPRYQLAMARALQQYGYAVTETDAEQSEAAILESLEIHRTLTVRAPGTPAYHILYAMSLQTRAAELQRRGHREDAKRAIRNAITHQQRYVELRPHSPFAARLMARLKREVGRMNAN